MGFADFLGNAQIVTALRGAMRAERVPHGISRNAGVVVRGARIREDPVARGEGRIAVEIGRAHV